MRSIVHHQSRRAEHFDAHPARSCPSSPPWDAWPWPTVRLLARDREVVLRTAHEKRRRPCSLRLERLSALPLSPCAGVADEHRTRQQPCCPAGSAGEATPRHIVLLPLLPRGVPASGACLLVAHHGSTRGSWRGQRYGSDHESTMRTCEVANQREGTVVSSLARRPENAGKTAAAQMCGVSTLDSRRAKLPPAPCRLWSVDRERWGWPGRLGALMFSHARWGDAATTERDMRGSRLALSRSALP